MGELVVDVIQDSLLISADHAQVLGAGEGIRSGREVKGKDARVEAFNVGLESFCVGAVENAVLEGGGVGWGLGGQGDGG